MRLGSIDLESCMCSSLKSVYRRITSHSFSPQLTCTRNIVTIDVTGSHGSSSNWFLVETIRAAIGSSGATTRSSPPIRPAPSISSLSRVAVAFSRSDGSMPGLAGAASDGPPSEKECTVLSSRSPTTSFCANANGVGAANGVAGPLAGLPLMPVPPRESRWRPRTMWPRACVRARRRPAAGVSGRAGGFAPKQNIYFYRLVRDPHLVGIASAPQPPREGAWAWSSWSTPYDLSS